MDEASSTPGSGQQNAVIEFDADGNGTYDKTFEGFSSFFGLNNFFIQKPDSIYDSKVVDRNIKVGGRYIDFSLPAQRVHDLVRGVNPWPGAYFLFF